MQIELSQKERMLLEDDKNQEEICVTKYKSYAQQAKDPELKQLFNTLSSEEQHHYDMVDQMLKGQEVSSNQILISAY
jgi:spore coat protein CotF